jgi:tetratricopeptide (TPR) repeat protein
MKKPVLFALTLYVVSLCTAAAQSLQPLASKDSVNILLGFSKKIYKTDVNKAICLTKRAYRYAQEAGSADGEGRSSFMLGVLYKEVNNYTESLNAYQHALRLFEKLNDSTQIGLTYNGMGGVYLFNLNHVTWSAYYFGKARTYLQHDSLNLALPLTNLGSLKLRTGKPDEALALYEAAYSIQLKYNDLPRMSTTLNNIATLLDAKKEYTKSKEYYARSLEIEKILENPKGTSWTLLGLAGACCMNNEHEQAEVYVREAMDIAKKYSLHKNYIHALQYLAYECEHTHKLKEAKSFALQASALADKHNLSQIKGELYQQLAFVCEKMGELKQALHYQQKHSIYKDSLAEAERQAAAEVAELKEKPVFASAPATANNYWPWLSFAVICTASIGFIFLRKKKYLHPAEVTEVPQAPIDEAQTPATDIPIPTQPENNGQATLPDTDTIHLEVINGQGMKLINLTDIQWFQKDGKSYHAFTEKGNYRVRQNMTELEESLPRGRFFRINRAVIINMDAMNNYSFWENHKYIIRMKDAQKTEFTISRNRLREMKENFNVFEH